MDYSESLNLPQTDFPMRGNLPEREPELLKFWQDIDIYKKVQEKNEGRPTFILHDGPPYANGDIHIGHVLNKVLKDIIIKFKSMDGYSSPYVPGWDTHGLPIELRAIKDFHINKQQVSKAELRKKCSEYADKFVDIQREEFKRLGVRGDWEHPYITKLPEYEAVQVGAFGEMAKKGYIYKGKKPVHWCTDCETALAEAEVEYQEDKSASIYIRFAVRDGKGVLPEDAYVVIWTTTPWTIPANLAICLHPDYRYVLFQSERGKLLVAKELLEGFKTELGLEECDVLAEFAGKELEGICCRHPLFDRDSVLILGDHVTLDAGTGCVHTAPGHGVEDFEAGRKYGLEVLSPVDSRGVFTEEAGPYAGLSTEAGNKVIVKDLEACGALLKFSMFKHQYPHCWRCHKPILFRATEQWFCSIDGFREQILEEIDKVKWIPSWGHDRIYNMVRDRSDWCISRQRTWGVPIPIFYCKECGKEIITDETIARIQELFREHGSQIWFEKEAEELIPEGLRCSCGCTEFRKETDTMDVWFDSGSSHMAVLDERPYLSWPADLYLEGSDQHRGWFNSSLSIAVAVKGHAPYRQVLTHGFLVDEKGHKMSKSQGNAVDPAKIIQQMGADVLRLWVSSADYRADLAISNGILKQVSEAYRKIRNTARFLLGNLSDFDPSKDALAYEELDELDQWALHQLNLLIEQVLASYREYEFHTVYHAIHKFCVVDMSAFYLDIVKDRLYTSAPDDRKRRATQTVLNEIINALMRLIAPVLTFTSEEIYRYLPKAADAPVSVQLLDMPPVRPEWTNKMLAEKWTRIFAVRERISKALEEARKSKAIGHSLDACVELYADAERFAEIEAMGQDWAQLCIVSAFRLYGPGTALPAGLTQEDGLAVRVTAAEGEKCERCWIYSETVGSDPEHPTLCARCAAVMKSR